MTGRGLGFDLQSQDALQRLSKDHLPRDPGSIALTPWKAFNGNKL